MNSQTRIAPSGSGISWWRLCLASISPNPRVLVMITVGCVAELVLLGCVRDNIYDVSIWTRQLAVAFVVWFWVTTGWVIWLALNRLRRPLARTAWIALLAVGFPLYGLSWGIYLRTSRFLDWDQVSFTVNNFHLLWMYARQAEHGVLLGSAAAVIGLGAAILGGGPWLTKGAWSMGHEAELRSTQRVTWYCLGVACVLAFLATVHSKNLPVMARKQDALRNCLHPVVAIAAGWTSATLDERILPCLEPAELRPLTDAAAWNNSAHVTNHANVVLITVESMRYDVVGLRHQGKEVMPVVDALARGGVQFTRAYAQTTHTDYSTTALYSSLFPLRTRRHLYFHSNGPWPKTLFYDVLKPAGYATAIISSQNQGWGGMDAFLKTPGLDLFYDPASSGEPEHSELSFDNLPDALTVGKAIEWIDGESARGRPFFLGVNLQTSHFPYKLPANAGQVFQPSTIDFTAGFFEYPAEKVEVIRNAYYNALRECDQQLGRLVEALRASGQLSHTIILLSGDHGEAFQEHGYVTHAREPIEPVIRTACLLYAPGMLAPRVDDYPVELVDLLPTALGQLGLSPHPNFQGIDVLATNRPAVEQRLLFFHTENPVARADGVLWMGRWKYVHDRNLGQESLYDVETDPHEDNELSARRPEVMQTLRSILQTWRRRQLAYYQFSMYYGHYYPPSPPVAPLSAP